jgi:hypothetical protein
VITTTVRIIPSALTDVERALMDAGKRVKPHEASIGVHDEDGGKAKLDYYGREQAETLAEVMIQHEYGDAGLLERSFLRMWFDANLSRLSQGLTAAARAELAGDTQAVRRWVNETHAEWKAWIEGGGSFAPLSQVTVSKKVYAMLPRPEAPLIATEQFLDAWKAKCDGVFV